MAKDRFKEISEYLKKARLETGLSQGEVADKLGYETAQFISNWERGLAAPPLVILKKIAKIYKVKAEHLFQLLLKDTERQMRNEFRISGT